MHQSDPGVVTKVVDSTFRFSLGGITFAVTVPPGYEKPSLNPGYTPFLSAGEPDIHVSGRTGRFDLQLSSCQPVFTAEPNWSMVRSGDLYLLNSMFEQALCTADFSRIDLYCRDTEDEVTPFFFDYPLPELVMINLLPRYQGLILHACGVKLQDGKVLLFCGMSGAGKSTMARIWEAHEKIIVLSDDRIVVRKVETRFLAYGTPWHGEAGHASPAMGEIAGIFFVEHAPVNRSASLVGHDAVTRLLTRSFPPMWDSAGMAATLEFAESLTSTVPCTVLGFVPDRNIIEFIRKL